MEKMRGGVLGFVFFAGIMMAGSDGQWFPWPNLLGVSIAGIAALFICAMGEYE